ncbi:hypothetical protein [Candidatus Bathycorpusculum sp.]|uniref:hypothetical protein n=1 Tax=Candidatus Bathycorpusculum sp. TaxID=2994959 RepID=UPI002831A6CB|nr:hypothetical protein [Candidatus Termitimicrobium sp.]
MNTKMFNQIIAVLVILSFVGLSLFSAEPIAAQSLVFNTVMGTGQVTGNTVRISGAYGLSGLAIYTRTIYDRSYDSIQVTLQRISDNTAGQLKLSIYSQDPNYDRPDTELQSFLYNYADLPRTLNSVVLNINSQILPANAYYLVFTLTGTSSVDDGVNILSYSSTSFSGDLGRVITLYRLGSGSWILQSTNIPFVLMGTRGTAPTPTPTPTATPTITPTPRPPTPTPTPPPPPTEAYAYCNPVNIASNEVGSMITSNQKSIGNVFYTEDYVFIDRVTFNLARYSTATAGTAVAKIYNFDGTTIGSLIAESSSVNLNTILSSTTTTYTTTFNFNNVRLPANQQYFVAVEFVTAAAGSLGYVQHNYFSQAPANTLRSSGVTYGLVSTGWQIISTRNMTFALFATPENPPTPTPPPPTPPPPDGVVDQNVFNDTSQKISIATGRSDVTTANSALLQSFSTASGKFLTSVTVKVNRLGSIPTNGEMVAGIATSYDSSGFNLIALSLPVLFNTISTNVNELTFYFDGTLQLNGDYLLVIAANNNFLSNFDDVPPCLQVVVQNSSDTAAVMYRFRGGQVNATDPALKMWYIIRGTDTAQPTPSPIPPISPSSNPQDPVPNPVWTWSIDTSPLWQPLLAWDFAGFILGCWTYSLGGSFFYILVLIISIALYIRYQNLTVLIVLWFIVGSLYAALIPLAGPVGISFIIFGFAGLLYKALAEPKT